MGNENNQYNVPGRVNIDKLHEEQLHLKQAQKASQIDPKQNVFNAMAMFSTAIDFGVSLALPLLGAVFAGNWLNTKYGSKYFVLILIPIAIAISIFTIYKQINKLKEGLKTKK